MDLPNLLDFPSIFGRSTPRNVPAPTRSDKEIEAARRRERERHLAAVARGESRTSNVLTSETGSAKKD